MGKKWKKLWLSRKGAATKKVTEEASKETKTKKVKKSPFWKKKKES
jgi:hypothetical protein